MSEQAISIQFNGLDADRHVVDMRRLGESLIGFEKIISWGVIFLTEQRKPKRRERHLLRVRALQPKQGSHIIPLILESAQEILPLLWPALTINQAELLVSWVGLVLDFHAGKFRSADDRMEKIIELVKVVEDGRRHSEEIQSKKELELKRLDVEREQKTIEQFRSLAIELVAELKPSAKLAVSTVGETAKHVTFGGGKDQKIIVDEADAAVIRSKDGMELIGPHELVLKTDGFKYHNRTLTVHHPSLPGKFLSAEVIDPIFEEEENVYTLAAAKHASIKVLVKEGHTNEELKKLFILHFIGEIKGKGNV